MNVTPELRQALIRARLLNAQAEAFVRWHQEALAPIIQAWPSHGLERVVSQLKQSERDDIEAMLDKLPGADEFYAMEQLVRGLTTGDLALMNSEDRLYMCEVRCHLDDALDLARRGEFQDAYYEATKAWERIDWILNGRKRKGDRNYRRLVNVDVRTALADARDGVGEMVHELHHAHAALAAR